MYVMHGYIIHVFTYASSDAYLLDSTDPETGTCTDPGQ